MKKSKPRLYKTEMVNAILAGKKTKTRRLQGLEIINENPDQWKLKAVSQYETTLALFESKTEQRFATSPFALIGNIEWVRETWATLPAYDVIKPRDLHPVIHDILYKADMLDADLDHYKWRSSIHMPRFASRIMLKIENITAERLQEISDADCIAEGMNRMHPKLDFQRLWDEIHAGGMTWQHNPWVWVASFKKVMP